MDLPVLHRLSDGSFLSKAAGLPVPVIDAEVRVTTENGTHTSCYRMVTTMLDPAEAPAQPLIRLYREWWEKRNSVLRVESTHPLRQGLAC